MAEKLDLSLKTIAAYSLGSNGIIEHHNAILTEIIKKVKEENVISWETATSWAANAKNCLVNIHGFSPYQIVYGRNPNLPSNIINKPPALENKTMMKRHLTDLQEVRKRYLAAESSERIQRALRKQIRLKGEELKLGEKAFFLRNGERKGLGWIIGKDNVVMIVRYGGTYVCVHESRLLRA